jgi:hypothetical protein
VALDPLDGSSNIDVNVSVGTIFSIYKRITPINSPLLVDDFLQKGRAQIASGYILYGPSSMLVFTTGNGVNGFTYESSLGEFVLSNSNIQCNEDGTIYSINEGLSNSILDSKVKAFITYCKDNELFVVYKAIENPVAIKIIDSSGKTVFTQSYFNGELKLDVSTWAKGVYTFEMEGGPNRKIIIE